MSIKDVCTRLPFFMNLEKEDKDLLIKHARINNFDKGNILNKEGDECLGLVMVLQGKVRAYTVSQEGKEITLYRLIDDDVCIMSAGCMLKEITFEISFMAEEQTTVFVIPPYTYKVLKEKYSHIKSYTLDLINSRFSDVMWVLEQYVFTKLATRLANLIIEHSAFSDNDSILVTHEDLARDLGTAREVVTRVLKQLEDDNVIKLYRGRIEIVDFTRLNQV